MKIRENDERQNIMMNTLQGSYSQDGRIHIIPNAGWSNRGRIDVGPKATANIAKNKKAERELSAG
jgi:hypothetical protein